MASYQRVALFILFDAIETDLIAHIRSASGNDIVLTETELDKAKGRLLSKAVQVLDSDSPFDLLYGLDLHEKYQVLMRNKDGLQTDVRDYFQSLAGIIQRSISVRNDVMHGRPLTVDEHIFAFSFAQTLVSKPGYWPTLGRAYTEYAADPTSFIQRSVEFLDEPPQPQVMHNLPLPDYDDTGFLPRPELERDLKKKILGRHPVVTLLGEGGNGKTALALQVLYGLVRSNDHGFDAIIWVSAKTSQLGVSGIRELQEVSVAAADIMQAGAALESVGETPRDRLYNMLSENKILLVIDNYETVVGNDIADFVQEVPGESKLLFTSRLPVGADLTVLVSELKEKDAKTYYYRLVEAYSVNSLKKSGSEEISRWLQELSFKPLLIKWFVLGVQSGLQPERIIANPETALRFCLDNVILTLGREAQAVLFVLATLPSPPGAGVIQQVGNLQAVQVGDGLAQLSRFGLIEASNLEDQGLVYNIKPFSRLYILRVINPKQSASDKIISRYREIESEFHSEKNRTINHYYSFKSYTIRSRSEMLIAKKLKEASGFAARGEFALADEILAEAKMLDPSYFETYRIESFVSQQQNDIPRALAAYSTAIKLGPDQPQLRFFYAGLLMRTGDNDSAADEFDAALEQDRTNGLVIREAARNKMIQYKWKEAQSLLDEALQIKVKEYREGIKLTDLQIQLYVRQMDTLVKSDQLDPAVEIAVLLSSYLHSIDRNRFDSLTISHLAKALPPLRVVRAQLPGSAVVGSLIETLHRDFLPDDWRVSSSPPARATGEQFSGRLKRDGRKSGFGFLASQGVEDTFVHRGDVSPSLWTEMLSDALVTFEIDTNEGRRRARNVVKAN